MNISKYLIIFFITFFQISVYSQGSLGADSISTPQAPNAASLGLYGDIPVSFHTGVPNISVPIFNVQDGALELPISISYHSSGVKVESVASWVGLGWSLNAGGVISRTIHGIKDEGGISPEFQNTEGYYETFGTTALDTNNMFDVNGSSFWTRIANNEIDGQSDMYNFNFNGYSGVFYFDENRKARFRNHQDLKLHVEFDEQVDPINDMHSRFVYFVITTPDGTKYYFGGDENGANINAIDRVFSRSLNFNNSVIPEVTAWHLVKVVDHNDAIQITLDYESQTFTTQTLGTWRSSVDVYDVFHGSSGQGTFDDGSITNLNLTQEARLSKITSTNHEVNFIAKDAREDLGSSSYFTGTIFGGNLPANTDPQAKRLEQIVIKGRKGSCLKTIDFTTDYFQCNQISYLTPYNPLTSAAGAGNPDLKKLRLLSIEEKVCNGQSIDPISHTFKYVDQDFGDVGAQIPGRLSLSQDMWGYFNGALGNTTLLPDRPHKYIPAQDVGYTPSPSLINLGFEQNCSGVPTNCDCEDVNKSVISVDDVILTPNWNDHMQISIDLSQKDFCNGNPNNGAPYTVQLNIYKKNIDGTESSVASRIFGFDQQNPSADASFKIKVPVDPGFNYIERGNIYRVELAKYGNSADKPFKMDLSVDEYNSGLAKYDLYPQWNDNIKKYNHPTLPIQVNSFLANRIPDAQKMKFGILKQVTYPTGGRTTFDFEPHDYKNSYNEFTKTYVDGTFNCQPGNSCADCQNNNAAEVNGLQFTLADNSEYYSVEATATRPNPNDGFTGCPTTTSPLDGMFYIIDEQTGERREFAMLLGGVNDPIHLKNTYRWLLPSEITIDPSHTYTLGVSKNSTAYFMRLEFSIYKHSVTTVTENVIVGGLRIKEIHNDPRSSTGSTQKFSYLAEHNDAWSSGELIGIPAFLQKAPHYDPIQFRPQAALCTDAQMLAPQEIQFYFSSSSAAALGATEGMHIGYKRVEVDYDKIKDGYNLYEYNILENPGISFSRHEFPVSPTWYEDLDNSFYLNGKLKREAQVDEDGNVVSETQYTYEVDEINVSLQRNMAFYEACQPAFVVCVTDRAAWTHSSSPCSINYIPRDYDGIARNYYNRRSAFVQNVIVENTLDGVTTINNFEYDKPLFRHTNVTAEWVENSDGRIHRTEYQYAEELNNTDLLARNIKGIPLETTELVDQNIVGGTVTQYGTINSLLVPTIVGQKEITSQASATTRTLMEIDEVNSRGDFLEYHRPEDVHISSIKGYDETIVIAKAINANLNEIAFTNFDDPNLSGQDGQWSYNPSQTSTTSAVLGAKGFVIGGSSATGITANGLPNGKYILSFWHKSGNVNVFINSAITQQIQGPTVTAGPEFRVVEFDLQNNSGLNSLRLLGFNAKIDELRLYPADAFMTTYNYDNNSLQPIAISDYNGVTAYYEYDDLQRLSLIRDFDGNILSLTEYSYDTTSAVNSIASNAIIQEGVLNVQDINPLLNTQTHRSVQYKDGFGRAIQNTLYKLSAAQRDIINVMEYDSAGRGPKEYLTFTRTASGNHLGSSKFVYQGMFFGSFSFNNKYPYSETRFEESPLTRPIAVSLPGKNFELGSGHESEIVYRANQINEVRRFLNGTSNGHYSPGDLYVTENHDQNGNVIITYTDKLQRTIMEDNEGAKTYYIYNNFGQLHCVLPPLLSNKLETDNAFTYLTPQNRIGAYLYSYDKWGRTISKDLPGANPTQLYYDRIDRLVMTKDGNGNKVITKYDRIGRPVITGLYTGNAIPSDAMGLFETASSSTFGYSLTNSFPSSGVEVLTVNYYDHYDLDRNGQVTSDEGYKTPLASQFPSSNFDLVKGKTVATLTGVLPSDGSAITDYLLGQVFYDKRGRTIQEKKDNHLSEKTVCYFEYNFPGWLISSRKDHRAVTGSVTHSYVIDKRFTYDHYGRKLSTFQSINGSPEVHLSKERYNERDFLIERKLGLNASGSKFLQDVDYRYDMRGWLTDINNINTSSGPSVPGGSTGGSSIGIGIGE